MRPLMMLLACLALTAAAPSNLRGGTTALRRRLFEQLEAVHKSKCHACCACKQFNSDDDAKIADDPSTLTCTVGKCEEDSREPEEVLGAQLYCWDKVPNSAFRKDGDVDIDIKKDEDAAVWAKGLANAPIRGDKDDADYGNRRVWGHRCDPSYDCDQGDCAMDPGAIKGAHDKIGQYKDKQGFDEEDRDGRFK